MEPPDPQLMSLGSFDPLALMLEFSDQYSVPPTAGRPLSIAHSLSRVPTSLLAHELTHLVHTLGTAAGLRHYLLAVESFTARLELIWAALEASDGKALRLPIMPNYRAYPQTERFASAVNMLGVLLVTSTAYVGGYRDDEPDHNINLAWLQPETKLGGLDLGWETSHFYLGYHTGHQKSVMSGYRHLTEGVAKIVERMQRRFAGEIGEQSPRGLVTLSPEQFDDHRSSPMDPYYVAITVFHHAKRFENPETRVPGYEEHVAALADLAMMVDPLVTPAAFSAIFHITDEDSVENAKTGYSPFALYHRLCHLFWRSVEEFPRLDEGDDQLTTKIVSLQNAMLAAAGSKLTMHDLTQEALESLERFQEHLDAQVFAESETVRDVYREGFKRVLSWRADVLAGSAIFEDLLTSREKLLDHARWWSPSYAIGGGIYSVFDVRPGEGVGVEQANIQMFNASLDAVCFRNSPCELRGPPRGNRCDLSPIGLCEGIPDRLPLAGQDKYCVREQFLGVLRSLGIDEIEWTR